MEAPHVQVVRPEARTRKGEIEVDSEPGDLEDWLMSDTGSRIEGKVDRLVGVVNDIHRELGAILARDAEQEKRWSASVQSTTGKYEATQADIKEIEGKLDAAREARHALDRDVAARFGEIKARVSILMWVASALVLLVFGILSKLIAGALS